MNTDDGFTPVTMVFAGTRFIDGKRYAAFYELDAANGELGPEQLMFAWEKAYDCTIGGVYEGASVRDKTYKGLTALRYRAMLDNPGARLEMRAKHERAMEGIATARLEKDNRRNEIEDVMLPLRRQYAKMLARYDMAACGALADAVLQALRTPVRKSEE